jgi:hypothetical protein
MLFPMTGADRHRVPFLLAAVVLLAQAPAVRPEDFSGTFSIAPPAAWVTEEREGTLAVPTRGRDDNEACILADYQENVATGELYTRIVTELRTAEGVQNGSTILAEYDPAYQTLVFHHIRVIRGAAASSRLSRDAVSLLRRETELEWSMIDGTVTASAVLQDVRPGDRIDYAYTVRGRNPAFGGLFADSFTFGWDMAVGRERVRVLSPSSRPLSYRAVGGEAGPRVSGDRGTTEYLWEFQDLAPIPLEDGTPPSHVTYPWIEITEFEDWAAVCRWALVLYPPAGLPEGLESLAAEWRGKSETPLAGL